MSAKVVRNVIYTHLNKKDYHGHIHQQYTYRDTKSIKGGFEIYHWRACLIVAVPTEFAKHLKSAGPERMESVIADFMGEIDENGVHHCVLLDASDDDLKSMQLKTQEMSGDLYKNGTWDFIFKQYPYAAKVHHFWEPTNTTMQVIDHKTVVVFNDFHGNEILRVIV
ncbi:hypothetical protein E8E14_005127 [Neopestalotiopsis sp. 37M]|nr:hypothetical protein E8E14_005127 [Neopestalotiopsis sp. 37M]